MAYNLGRRTLYNLPWRASVSSYQVQCNTPTFQVLLWKICINFLNDAESLTTYGCVLWCKQIVYSRPYSSNTTTAFYFTTDCSDVTVFVRLRACVCHNAFVLHLAIYQGWTQCPTLQQSCTKFYGLANNSVKEVTVTLLFYLRTRYELFCCVCFYQSA